MQIGKILILVINTEMPDEAIMGFHFFTYLTEEY
jgi:hypothetical protein